MKVTRSQKYYLAVLGLAFGAWGVDRAFFSAVSPASGAVAPHPPEAPGATLAPAADQPSDDDATDRGLSEQLRRIAGPAASSLDHVRDAFVIPEGWVGRRQPATDAHLQQDADEFVRKHKLLAIVMDAQGGRALVNDRLVPVGQSIGRFRLTSISGRNAVFRGEGTSVCLTLDPPAAISPDDQ